jgi:hypothetical protein
MQYWIEHTRAALEWRDHRPKQCHLLRYEEVVTSPEAAVAAICSFLGVQVERGCVERAFQQQAASPGPGPGDHKLAYTDGVERRLVGAGKSVPVDQRLLVEVEAERDEGLSTRWAAVSPRRILREDRLQATRRVLGKILLHVVDHGDAGRVFVGNSAVPLVNEMLGQRRPRIVLTAIIDGGTAPSAPRSSANSTRRYSIAWVVDLPARSSRFSYAIVAASLCASVATSSL